MTGFVQRRPLMNHRALRHRGTTTFRQKMKQHIKQKHKGRRDNPYKKSLRSIMNTQKSPQDMVTTWLKDQDGEQSPELSNPKEHGNEVQCISIDSSGLSLSGKEQEPTCDGDEAEQVESIICIDGPNSSAPASTCEPTSTDQYRKSTDTVCLNLGDIPVPGHNDLTRQETRVKGFSKRPSSNTKRVKSRPLACRNSIRRHVRRNSHRGRHLSLQNHPSRTRMRARSSKGLVFTESILDCRNIPMEVELKTKPTKLYGQLSSPANAGNKGTPLMNEKFSFAARKNLQHNIVSCSLPCETSLCESQQSGDDTVLEEDVQPYVKPSSGKNEFCYIFAFIDREKDEAIFKCSHPQLKSSEILQRLASVLEAISTDDDIMISNKIVPPENDKAPVKLLIDKSTSPSNSFTTTSEFENLGSAEVKNSDGVGQQGAISRTIQLIVLKDLYAFSSEMKSLVDISIRLLDWCSLSTRGEVDSSSIEGPLEGFLCHCHDKVSCVMECFSFLDSEQILNVDKMELKRLWLLHDGICCLLLACRHIQYSPSSSTIKQQLLSLLMTCSKMILPGVGTGINEWTGEMEKVCRIGKKLHESFRGLPTPCKCHQHFESLKNGTECRVCDVDHLYQEICKGGKKLFPQPSTEQEVEKNKSIWAQLFPRFCWFLTSIEEWSKEQFNAALAKHCVVKFSCNIDSGLHPCKQHLFQMACNCFTPLFEPSTKETEIGIDICRVDLSSRIQNIENSPVLNTVTPLSVGRRDASNSPCPVREQPADKALEEEKRAANSIEELQISSDESASESHFSLRLSDNDQDDSSHRRLEEGSEANKIITTSGNESIRRTCAGQSKLVADSTSCNKGNAMSSKPSPGIDYSPLNYQQAKSNLSKMISSTPTCHSESKLVVQRPILSDAYNDMDTSTESQPSIIVIPSSGEVQSSDFSELPKDVNIDNGLAFEDSLGRSSMCPNNGSIVSLEETAGVQSRSGMSLNVPLINGKSSAENEVVALSSSFGSSSTTTIKVSVAESEVTSSSQRVFAGSFKKKPQGKQFNAVENSGRVSSLKEEFCSQRKILESAHQTLEVEIDQIPEACNKVLSCAESKKSRKKRKEPFGTLRGVNGEVDEHLGRIKKKVSFRAPILEIEGPREKSVETPKKGKSKNTTSGNDSILSTSYLDNSNNWHCYIKNLQEKYLGKAF